MAFLNPDGEFLCNSTFADDFCSRIQCNAEYRKLCNCSDRELLQCSQNNGRYECHICHAGLYDAAIPMIKNGMFAGSVIMGRIRASMSPAEPYITNDPELVFLYQCVPEFTDSQLENLRILLPNILFESAIEIKQDPLLDEIVVYINSNLQKTLNLPELCERFHISKNVLYQRFHSTYNCTVNSFITDRRIELAKKLLLSGEDPAYLVAEKTGLGCDTYFNKIFKKKTGITPAAFRKMKQSR